MRKTLALVFLSLGIAFVSPIWSVFAQIPSLSPLPPKSMPIEVPPPLEPDVEPLPLQLIDIDTVCPNISRCPIGLDAQIWGENGNRGDYRALLTSIDNSLRYLATDRAAAVYQNYPIKEITLDRVRRSLLRFRQLVLESKSPEQLQANVRREFAFYQSIGHDGNASVKFTAYYEPVYTASRVRTRTYRYPIYRLPPDFRQWSKPHPTRLELEGRNGVPSAKSPIRGMELFWLRNRLDAYLIQIQGSAQLRLTDGTKTSVGYAGGTDYPWTSIGRELAKDGKLPLKGLTMPKLISYFRRNPREMSNYLPRWERFVFFKETHGAAATGSIRVPVTAERSIATDKSLMPPGALALVHVRLPFLERNRQMVYRTVSRYVLDQDTGSAIKGPGRVDYFMGTGQSAGDRAGVTGNDGQLYYLLLRE